MVRDDRAHGGRVHPRWRAGHALPGPVTQRTLYNHNDTCYGDYSTNVIVNK